MKFWRRKMNKYDELIDAFNMVLHHCNSIDCSACPLDSICYDTLTGRLALYHAVRRAKEELEHYDE